MPQVAKRIVGLEIDRPRAVAGRTYTLYEIARDDLFEYGEGTFQARRTRARSAIQTDKLTEDILEATFEPDPERLGRRRYAIRGENIVRYLAIRDERW